MLLFTPGQAYDPLHNEAEDARLVEALQDQGVELVLLETVSWFGTAERLSHFPQFHAWLQSYFTPTRRFGLIEVYEHNETVRSDFN